MHPSIKDVFPAARAAMDPELNKRIDFDAAEMAEVEDARAWLVLLIQQGHSYTAIGLHLSLHKKIVQRFVMEREYLPTVGSAAKIIDGYRNRPNGRVTELESGSRQRRS